ncbi:hypothetical protein L7F22_015353 [Adiantum nelumboides]|nr:hypothetical protein [Adiantum nelumboides]
MAGKAKKGRREGMKVAYSTPPPKKSAGRAGRGAKQPLAMRAMRSRAGPTPVEEVKEVGGDLLAVSQPDVVPKPLRGKIASVTGERKKKAPKVPKPWSSKIVQALDQGVPPLAVVEPEPCKPAAVTKEGKKGALKAQQPEQGLKIATPQGQDAPLSMDVPREPCQGLKRAMPLKIDAPLLTEVPREPCQGAASKKAPKSPKVPKEIQPKKQIAMPKGQDAPLSTDVPREQGQGVALKKAPIAPKVPKEAQPTKQGLKIATPLKIAMLEGQDAPLSTDVPQEQGQGATLKKAPKAPKEAQPTKKGLKIATPASQDAPLSSNVPQEPCQDGLNLVKGLGVLKAQKSGQSKEVSGTAGTRPGALKAPKAPKEDQQTKHVGLCPVLSVSARDMIVFEGLGPLKVQKSGQAKKLSGTAGSKTPKTQVNKRMAKADVKEKEGTVVPDQHNVKRMKEVGVRESIEWKLTIDEVKVKGHTGKGQLEKCRRLRLL